MARTYRPDPLIWRCPHCKAMNRRSPDQLAGGDVPCRECKQTTDLEPLDGDYRNTLGDPYSRERK